MFLIVLHDRLNMRAPAYKLRAPHMTFEVDRGALRPLSEYAKFGLMTLAVQQTRFTVGPIKVEAFLS